MEGPLFDRREPLGEGEGGEGGASAEGSYSDRSEPLVEGEVGEGGAAVEGPPSDHSEPLGDGDGGERGASAEGSYSDRSESLGEYDGGEGGAVGEGIPVNGRNSGTDNNVCYESSSLVVQVEHRAIARPSQLLAIVRCVAWVDLD